MENDKRGQKLREIKEEVINFQGSPLAEIRRAGGYYPVIGEGNHYARIMFVGEAPGKNEAKWGRPFCGSAGQILNELLEKIELKRESVYIANILKDRPPANRDPLPEEIVSYAPFLDRQIKIIQPKIIVALGRFSAHYLLNKFGLANEIKPITVLQGKVFEVYSKYGEIKIIPFLHPASAIYDPRKKEILFNYFKLLKKYEN